MHVQRQFLRADTHRDGRGVFGLSNEQRATNSGVYCLCGQRWKLLPDLDRDRCGLHAMPCRHVQGSLAFPDSRQHGLHALRRRNVRPCHRRRLDSTHDVLRLGRAVLAAGDMAHSGCDGLHNLRLEHLRDGQPYSHGRQHGLPKLPRKQRPYLGLWLVHVQRQLLRTDPYCDLWGLHGLPNEQRATNSGLYVLPLQRELLLSDYRHNDPVVLGLPGE